MLTPWLTLSSQDVSPSKWFPVIRDEVQLPDGTVIDDYYYSPLGGVVMVLPLTPAGEIVLVKQYKHGLKEILLELPGGMQQEGKTIEESALAELEEETGIRASAEQLIPLGRIANNPTKTDQVTWGFLVKNAEFNSQQHFDPTEQIQVITLPAAQVLEMVKNGEIWVTDSVSFLLKASYQHPEIFQAPPFK